MFKKNYLKKNFFLWGKKDEKKMQKRKMQKFNANTLAK